MISNCHGQANSPSFPDTWFQPSQPESHLSGRKQFVWVGNVTISAHNLQDKVNYIVYYCNLKLYLQLGLVVTKVHRVLTFKQSPSLKAYIDFNTNQCSLAGDFFKLMKNNVFGKKQEKLRNRVNVKLFTDARILRKRVAKPSFCRGNPTTDCLTVVQCKLATLTLNQPIYVGCSELELSKLHMYDFHYNHMCVKYPCANQLQLLFMNTDSLAYAV